MSGANEVPHEMNGCRFRERHITPIETTSVTGYDAQSAVTIHSATETGPPSNTRPA